VIHDALAATSTVVAASENDSSPVAPLVSDGSLGIGSLKGKSRYE